MSCLECGDPVTCKAHVIPGAIGRDIIRASDGRRTLSLAAPDRTDDHIQSGIFDANILCARCDGNLGQYNNHAIEITRLLGTPNEMLTRDNFCIFREEGVNHEYLTFFAAAVVWRGAVSNYRELAQFTLDDGEKDRFRAMAFRATDDLPTVVILRLVSENPIAQGAAATAMSYPSKFTTDSGHSRVKFSTRGLLFLVQLGQASDPWLQDHAVTKIGAAKGPKSLVGPLFSFEGLLEADNVRQTRYVQNILGS